MLAMMELAAMIKLAAFALLLANVVVPAGMATPGGGALVWALSPVWALLKLTLAMTLLGVLELSMAKLRFYGLPEDFFGSLFLGLTSLALGLVALWL